MAELNEILPTLSKEGRQKLLEAMIERCQYEHQWAAIEEAMRIIKELDDGQPA